MSQSSGDLALPDLEFHSVLTKIQEIEHLEERSRWIIRDAIDDVIRGDRTGRYSIAQLTKQEKAHIGTQIEISLVREFFDLRQGQVLDTTVSGVEVDIKHTIGSNWMIPEEAIRHICLLVKTSEENRCFSIGLIRAQREDLGAPNRDRKRGLTSSAREQIAWILRDSQFPVSIFLTMPPEDRDAIFSHTRSGQKRVNELFRRFQRVPIMRADLCTLARQRDPMKRGRDAKKQLQNEGIGVVCGRYADKRQPAIEAGLSITKNEWVSFPSNRS